MFMHPNIRNSAIRACQSREYLNATSRSKRTVTPEQIDSLYRHAVNLSYADFCGWLKNHFDEYRDVWTKDAADKVKKELDNLDQFQITKP